MVLSRAFLQATENGEREVCINIGVFKFEWMWFGIIASSVYFCVSLKIYEKEGVSLYQYKTSLGCC